MSCGSPAHNILAAVPMGTDCYLAAMILGKVNTLKVHRHSDFGFYLIDEAGDEVLLPNAFVSDDLKEGDEIDVFIYTDSEDRIVATTLKPRIRLGEFAWLKCKDVNQTGAFADWGMSKDLFIPFAEQLQRMEAGSFYPVHLLEDERTKRLIGSSRIRDFLEMEDIPLEPGEKVELFFYERNEFGYAAVINEKYRGLLFQSDAHKPIRLGDKMRGYVKVVREDGKVDVVLTPPGYRQAIDTNTQVVLDALIAGKGSLALTDKSTPELINQELGLSKKALSGRSAPSTKRSLLNSKNRVFSCLIFQNLRLMSKNNADGCYRENITEGDLVEIVQKHHQRSGELTEGFVGRILTSASHPHTRH